MLIGIDSFKVGDINARVSWLFFNLSGGKVPRRVKRVL